MKVRVRLLSGEQLPTYQTKGAVAFDVAATQKTVIAARSLGYVPTGLVVEVPEGYALLLCARSSTPKKKGLLIPHGVGLIDQDYCGPEDELLVQYYNFTDADVVLEVGERCAQGLFVRIGVASFEESEELARSSRGGFGSTGL